MTACNLDRMDGAVHLPGDEAVEVAFTSKSRAYERSKSRYEAVEDDLFDARRHVVPPLRRRLGHVREHEQALARRLEALGVDVDTIGPIVPPERAQETAPRPGEEPIEDR